MPYREIRQHDTAGAVASTDAVLIQQGGTGTAHEFTTLGSILTGGLPVTHSAVNVTGTEAPSNGMYLPAGNTIGWAINGVAEMQLTATSLSPAASGGLTLGTTTLPWGGVQLANGAALSFANDDMTITHGSNVLTVAGGALAVESLLLTALADGPSYDDDAAAAAGGVGLKRMYRNGNFLMVRLT